MLVWARSDRAIFFLATQVSSHAVTANCGLSAVSGGGAVSATRPVMLPMLPDPNSGKKMADTPPTIKMISGYERTAGSFRMGSKAPARPVRTGFGSSATNNFSFDVSCNM
jgi:hypothetical protein